MEYFEVYYDNGNPAGKIEKRGKVHSKGLWHRTVHIWIYKDSKILLQMRSKSKDSHPGLWDVSAAGHIEIGEEPLTAALREVQEELGIELNPDCIRFVDKRQFSITSQKGKFKNNEITFIYTYEFKGNIDDLSPNLSEIDQLKFFNIDHLKGLLDNHERRKEFVPYDNSYYKWILGQIAN